MRFKKKEENFCQIWTTNRRLVVTAIEAQAIVETSLQCCCERRLFLNLKQKNTECRILANALRNLTCRRGQIIGLTVELNQSSQNVNSWSSSFTHDEHTDFISVKNVYGACFRTRRRRKQKLDYFYKQKNLSIILLPNKIRKQKRE